MIGFLFAADKFAVNGIVQSENGDGLKKVELTIFDTDGEEVKSTKSKKDGSFKFKKIEQGDYTLFGDHKKFGKGTVDFSISDEDIVLNLRLFSEDEDDEEKQPDEKIVDEVSSEKKKIETPPVLIPKQRDEPSKRLLKFEKTFFEYEANLKTLKTEIDSLKSVVKGYEKNQRMPNINREILDLIKVPNYENRIELQNGTVVTGNILEESDSTLVLKTQIGTLVLKKEMVIRMDKFDKPAPKVVFLGDPFIDYYPDRQIFSGRIKNEGEIRADFVREISNLFDQTTANSGVDSIFVKGTRIVYETMVVSDTALEPGQTITYELTVPIKKGRKVQYHTMDIHWDQTQ